MTFTADFPGAIVVEAAQYGYPHKVRGNCVPKAFCLHTPEEPPDNYPSTPYYFHNLTNRAASTTYFVSYLGLVFQCVPEDAGAYANAREGVFTRFGWETPGVTLNLQTISVEIEGFASSIHQTMPRGSPQWVSLVRLMAHRCKALGIPPERTFGHKEVSVYRSDPGKLDIAALVADVRALITEEDSMTPEQAKQLADIHAWLFTPIKWGENKDGGWYGRTATRAEMLETVARYLDNGQGALGKVLALLESGTGPLLTAQAIAKAVNDEAAARLAR